MDTLSQDLFASLGRFLTIKDIISLAATNRDIREAFLKKEINTQLANHFGFPYGLTLAELRKYEEMSLKDRLIAAVSIGDERIVNKMIEFGVDDFESALAMAAKHGRINLVRRFLDFGAHEYNASMIKAARRNHIQIVELLFEKGATNLYRSAIAAAEEGHEDMIDKLLELDKTDNPNIIHVNVNSSMAGAARTGRKEIVEKFIQLGANNWNLGLLFATYGDQIETAKMMLRLGATNINIAIQRGYEGGHKKILSFLKNLKEIFDKLGVTNLIDAIDEAVETQRYDYLALLDI